MAMKELASRRSGLPTNYIEAKKAISQCARVDECQAWVNKAVALKSYANQMRDTTLRDNAQRIIDRAIRRGGELLQQVTSQKGKGRRLKGTTAPIKGRNGAARDAGLSPGQAKQMLRVARVPQEQFESLVEGKRPPGAKALAEIGTEKKPKPQPEPYRNEWIDWTSAVMQLAALPACGLEVLAKRNPYELARLRENADDALRNLSHWRELIR